MSGKVTPIRKPGNVIKVQVVITVDGDTVVDHVRTLPPSEGIPSWQAGGSDCCEEVCSEAWFALEDWARDLDDEDESR